LSFEKSKRMNDDHARDPLPREAFAFSFGRRQVPTA